MSLPQPKRKWRTDQRSKVQPLHQEPGINKTRKLKNYNAFYANLTLLFQDGYCDVALTSNTFDLGSGDNLSFGNNVQSGSTFGTSGSLTCENPPSSSVLVFYLLPCPTLICGFREFHRPIRSDNLFGFWQRGHEHGIWHQLPTVTLLDSPILDSSSPLFNESLYREPFIDSPTCQAQYFLWYSEKNNQPTSTANIIIQKTGKVFSMNKCGHFLLTSPMWLPCGLFKLYLFFYFSRDKACRDHKKTVIRIGYIHKAYIAYYCIVSL